MSEHVNLTCDPVELSTAVRVLYWDSLYHLTHDRHCSETPDGKKGRKIVRAIIVDNSLGNQAFHTLC